MLDGSILNDVKASCGIVAEYDHFDNDIIIATNSVFAVLRQLGVGPAAGFSISDSNSKWSDFIEDDDRLSFVKTYVCARVRLIFDPPASSTLMQALKETVDELTFRIVSVTDYEVEEADESDE